MKTIDRFDNEHEFLSNFYPAKIVYEGIEYSTTEHAFQAVKSLDQGERIKIRNAKTAGIAKRMGKKVNLRNDWESTKIGVMLDVLRLKFAIPELRQALLNTGNAILIEGNHHGDVFWGTANGRGKNNLGKLLMKVREEVR